MKLTIDDASRIKEACEGREYKGALSLAKIKGHGSYDLMTEDGRRFIRQVPGVWDDDVSAFWYETAAFFALAQEVMPQVPALIEEVERLRAQGCTYAQHTVGTGCQHCNQLEIMREYAEQRDEEEARAEAAEARVAELERDLRTANATLRARQSRLDVAQAERDEAREQRDALAAWVGCNTVALNRPEHGRLMQDAQSILADRIRREREEAWDEARQGCTVTVSYDGDGPPTVTLDEEPNPYSNGGDDD